MDEDSQVKKRIENLGLGVAVIAIFLAIIIIVLAAVALIVGLCHFIAVYAT